MFLTLIGMSGMPQLTTPSTNAPTNGPFPFKSPLFTSPTTNCSQTTDNSSNSLSTIPDLSNSQSSIQNSFQNAHSEMTQAKVLPCKLPEVSGHSSKETNQTDNHLPVNKLNDKIIKEDDVIIIDSDEIIESQVKEEATSKNHNLIDATITLDHKIHHSSLDAQQQDQNNIHSKLNESVSSKECISKTKATDNKLKNEEIKNFHDHDSSKHIKIDIKNNDHLCSSKDLESHSSIELEMKKSTIDLKKKEHSANISASFKEQQTKELHGTEENKLKKQDERAIKLVEKIKKASVKFKDSRTTSNHLNKSEPSRMENATSGNKKKDKPESSQITNMDSALSLDKKPSISEFPLNDQPLPTKVQVKMSSSSIKEKTISDKNKSTYDKKNSPSNLKEKHASNNRDKENSKIQEKKKHSSKDTKSLEKPKIISSSKRVLDDKKHKESNKHAERERHPSKDSFKSDKIKDPKEKLKSKEKHLEKKDMVEHSKHHSSSSDKLKSSSHSSKHHNEQKSNPPLFSTKRDQNKKQDKVSHSQSKHKHPLKRHSDSLSQEDKPCKQQKIDAITSDDDHSLHEPFHYDDEDISDKDHNSHFKNGLSKKNISEEYTQFIDELGNDIESDETLKQCWEIFNEEVLDFQKEEVPFKKAKVEIPEDTSKKKRQAHQPNLKRESSYMKPQPRLTPFQVMQQRLSQSSRATNHTASGEHKSTKNNPFSHSHRTFGAERKRIQGANPNIHLLTALNKKIQQESSSSSSSLPNDLNPNVTSSKTHSKGTRRIAHVPLKSTKPRPTVQVDGNLKVPFNTRQRYLNSMIDECLKFCHTEDEAYKMALEEEKGAYSRSNNRAIYLNVACNIINRLRRRHSEENNAKVPSTNDLVLGGAQAARTSFSIERKPSRVPTEIEGPLLYKLLKPYLMTPQQLEENNYPIPHPTERGCVTYPNLKISPNSNSLERTCCRCQKRYRVDKNGQYISQEECIYHWGRLWKKKIAGSLESRYFCCQSDTESSGCCIAPGHVHDTLEEKHLRGYVTTMAKSKEKDDDEKDYGVYGLDCEMCYTTEGLELIRVSLVNSRCQSVYETLVKPDNPILDANTRFSGLKESDLQNVTTRLHQVQAVLLNLLDARSILIGHSLESDLRALRLCHSRIVDTSIVFPHKLGPPLKRSLRALMAEYLNKIIQNDLDGHDSKEDASAAMQLMLHKVKEDARRTFR